MNQRNRGKKSRVILRRIWRKKSTYLHLKKFIFSQCIVKGEWKGGAYVHPPQWSADQPSSVVLSHAGDRQASCSRFSFLGTNNMTYGY